MLEEQVELLTEALRLFRQKRFGASSERTSEDAIEQLSLLFNEVEVYTDQAAKEDHGSMPVAAHKRHKKHEYTLDHLHGNIPVEVVEHRLPEEKLVCLECGSTMSEIGVVGCWAHARRKFDEAMKSLPKEKAKNSSAAQKLAYCNLLFKMEEGLADLSPRERYNQRLKQARPVSAALLAWANTGAAAPKSVLGGVLLSLLPFSS